MKPELAQAAWVGLGSAAGACARWAFGLGLAGEGLQIGAPWGTLAVNTSGSLAIGLYAAMAFRPARGPVGNTWDLLVMAGFCGGFTTFSLFTAEVLGRVQAGDAAGAGVLLLASTGAWLAGAWTGHALGRVLSPAG